MRQLIVLLILTRNTLCYGQNKNVAEVIKKAEILISEKQYQQAIEVYSNGIKTFDNDSQLYRERGIIYMVLKDYQKAAEDFSKIIEVNKSSVAFAYFNRGICKFSLNEGQISSGCADLVKAKELGYEANWNDFSPVCPSLD